MDKISRLEFDVEDLKKSLYGKKNQSGAIGRNAQTVTGGAAGDNSSSLDGFAGGENAVASANGAVQLGQGTNNNANTLQFKNFQILDSTGKIPNDRLNVDNSPTENSSNPISSDALFGSLHGQLVFLTLNSTYVDTNQTGNAFYMRIGNFVFVYINDITFKNVKQVNENVIISGLPRASRDYIFNMVCWAGTLTCSRYIITSGETVIRNFWSTVTPTTSQKWSANFVYLTDE